MEIIEFPQNLTAETAIDISLRFGSLAAGTRVRVQIPNNIWVTPFGMLMSCAVLRRFDLELPDMMSPHLSYVRWMGWADCIGAPTGVRALEGGETYLPITKINLSANVTAWRQKVVATSNDLASLVTKWPSGMIRRDKKNLRKWLSYVFREIIRNTPEHAGTGQVWVAAQFWPGNGKLEIAVLDNGHGVLHSLRSNPNLSPESDVAALKMAVSPGVSSIPEGVQPEGDEWGNSGYGLYVLSRLATEAGGTFQIVSGGKALYLRDNGARIIEANHQGTGIKLVFKPKNLEAYDKFMGRVIPEGERISQRRASTMTRSLS